MNIGSNIQEIRKSIPTHVKLVAVSKTKPVSDLEEAYQSGQRIFGENKALEMRDKHEIMPNNIEWHFIGHLQTNKIKYIIPFVSLIHSIDSFKLLKEVNKEALKHNRCVDCLLQFHIATEESKFGLDMKEAHELLQSEEFSKLNNIRIVGVMGMATYTENQELIRKEFRQLKQYFIETKEKHFVNNNSFCEISMGMSGDYKIAIEEGSTLVRIGSSIFGERNYTNISS
jgi:PLP dependent protein